MHVIRTAGWQRTSGSAIHYAMGRSVVQVTVSHIVVTTAYLTIQKHSKHGAKINWHQGAIKTYDPGKCVVSIGGVVFEGCDGMGIMRLNSPLCRIMYQEPCEASTEEAEYHSPFDAPETMVFIGYPETDEHFRGRLKAQLVKPTE